MTSVPRASVAELSYIAGYTDGEGCIGVYSGRYVLAYESCHPEPIRKIASIFGGIVRTRKRIGKGQTNRTVFVLRFYSCSCILILKMILPYLIEKKEQAESVIQIETLKSKLRQSKKQNHK